MWAIWPYPCEDVFLDSRAGSTELNSGAATQAAFVPPQTPQTLRHRLLSGLALLIFYLAVELLLPRPESVKPAGWRLLGIFVATIGALVLRPIPGGAAVLLALTLPSVFGGLTL